MIKYLRHCNAQKHMKLKSIFELCLYIKQTPLQKENFIALAKKFKFTEDQSARMMGMSLRTFRKKTLTADLTVLASEMVVRLSELYETGVDTFGDPQLFVVWLNSNSIVFGNIKPALLIESGLGVSLVRDQLINMQYGILA